MGQGTPGGMGKQGVALGDRKPGGDGDKKDRKFSPPAAPSRVGRKQCKQKGPEAAARLPIVVLLSKCRLRLLKLEHVKDYLLMEEEFVASQECLRPTEEKTEEDRSKVDDLCGTPMSVGSLEEIIDESHAIVSSVGPEYYVDNSASSPSSTRTSSSPDAPSSCTTRFCLWLEFCKMKLILRYL